ncbi:MAG: ribonuclease HII [Coprobacillus sp.]|nr:ribonuclease HII [Coprobacillus sp.]
MLNYEKDLRINNKDLVIVGTDEAGRGPLLGPVFAAAVIFPIDYVNEAINDSKQLTDKKRRELYEVIKKDALVYSIVSIPPEVIDEVNILQASKRAMEEAISKINVDYDLVITDAVKIDSDKPVIPLIKGDAKAMCVAAASILAKVSRDNYCLELDKKYPQYKIARHKGYPTKEHLEILNKYGPIKGVYRFSYAPVKKYLEKK